MAGNDYGRLLLEAIKAGVERQHEEKTSKQKDQQIKLQEKELNANIKKSEDEFKQRGEHFQLTQDVLGKQLALKIFEAKKAALEDLQQGKSVPGTTVAPTSEGTGGALYSPANPNSATQQMVTMPKELGGGQQMLPSPTQFATKQAELSKIQEAPKHEARLEEIKKTRELQEQLMEKSKQNDYERAFMQKAWDDARNQESIKARNEQSRLDRISNEKVAGMRVAANAIPDDFDYSGFIQKGLAGDVSAEEIQKLGKPALRLKNVMSQVGGKFLNKDEQEVVSDFKMMVDSVGLMDQVIANQPQSETWGISHLRGLVNSGNTAVTTPEAELDGRLSNIARGLMKERGALSNKDIERAQALMPSRFQPVQANIKKRNDLVKQIRSVIDAKLSTVPEAQRKVIIDKVGLNKIEMLGGKQAEQPNQKTVEYQWTPEGFKQ